MTNEYEQQANAFLDKTTTLLIVKFLKHGKHFDDDKEERDIYEVTLQRGDRKFTFNFGQSIACSGKWILYGYNEEGNWSNKKTNNDREAMKHKANGKEAKKNTEFKQPTAYDVLACLTKNEVGSFEDFCADYGYDTDSRKAEKIYQAVLNEWNNIKMLFTDKEIEELQEIQ